MSNNGAGKPIVALDIDGTLGDYHSHFIAFAEGWLGESLIPADKVNDGQPLYQHLGLARHTYQQIKLAYRQGGLKRTMPAYPWASGLTKWLRDIGAEVWICTTRPYMRLDNIEPDTVEWLRRNQIHYDALLFDTLEGKYTKYRELARQAADRVVCIMDDLPEALQAAYTIWPNGEDGLLFPNARRVLLRDQPYNRYLSAHEQGWSRVTDSEEITTYISAAVSSWFNEHGEFDY